MTSDPTPTPDALLRDAAEALLDALNFTWRDRTYGAEPYSGTPGTTIYEAALNADAHARLVQARRQLSAALGGKTLLDLEREALLRKRADLDRASREVTAKLDALSRAE